MPAITVKSAPATDDQLRIAYSIVAALTTRRDIGIGVLLVLLGAAGIVLSLAVTGRAAAGVLIGVGGCIVAGLGIFRLWSGWVGIGFERESRAALAVVLARREVIVIEIDVERAFVAEAVWDAESPAVVLADGAGGGLFLNCSDLWDLSRLASRPLESTTPIDSAIRGPEPKSDDLDSSDALELIIPRHVRVVLGEIGGTILELTGSGEGIKPTDGVEGDLFTWKDLQSGTGSAGCIVLPVKGTSASWTELLRPWPG